MENKKNGEKEAVALFQNPFLERLSHTNAFSVIGTFIGVSLLLLIYNLTNNSETVANQLLIYFLGWLTFTFIEYVFHRFLYHSEHYKEEEHWQYKIHGVHHDHPTHKDRLAMPLILALALAFGFYILFSLIMGEYAILFLPGFMLGYGLYICLHYLVHTRRPPNNFMKILWIHHHVHHYQDENRAFGVSTTIWDRVFGTMPKIKNS
jgi:4-hydroxysphinganine ceramide fatty acyl 2-hydroxylase